MHTSIRSVLARSADVIVSGDADVTVVLLAEMGDSIEKPYPYAQIAMTTNTRQRLIKTASAIKMRMND